jgi:hypothetical protein
MTSTCELCAGPLPVSRQPKRFCSPRCRSGFHDAVRRIGEQLYQRGEITIEQIRSAKEHGP